MEALGLDPATAPTSTSCPAATLATVNLMSLFGLHRRLRGAIVGHLALFEMTSSIPNRRYANGLRRLGFDDPAATEFFDEHVDGRRGARGGRRRGPRRRPRPARARPGRRHPLGRPRAGRLEGAGRARCCDAWEGGALVAARPLGRTAGAQRLAAGSAPLGALKRTSLCVPSQNGRRRDLPQRHSATARAPTRSRCRPGRAIRNGAAHEQRPVAVGRDRDVVGHRHGRYPSGGGQAARAARGGNPVPEQRARHGAHE